ncbi:hypothetical protein LNV09_17790 [Paucibacter sp. B2R-40]|nr:hypothetical protein [Paucibacter sp. B2R-40]MCV2355996.1 hypothetical protein [Paucibacter sp. B2R-40]
MQSNAAVVRFNEGLDDGQAQSKARRGAGLAAGFALVEDLFYQFGGNALAVVADPAIDGS